MRAIVQAEYGSTNVLTLADVDKPICTGNEVLINVHNASVNASDWH